MEFNNDELRAKYNPEGSPIRKAQLRMLEILVEVDKICRRHNITYWLSCGSMLGAVRHKGFIPWDDDLDIELLKPDYDKLLKILQDELPDNLALQTRATDKNYFFFYAKVRDRNSRITERTGYDRILKEQGLWIDIFPVEKISRSMHKLANKTFGHAYKILRTTSDDNKAARRVRFWTALNRNFIFPILKVISFLSRPKFYDFSFGIPYFHRCRMSDYMPIKYVPFESFEAPVANNTHNYLTDFYGDYMKLPEHPGSQFHDTSIEIW